MRGFSKIRFRLFLYTFLFIIMSVIYCNGESRIEFSELTHDFGTVRKNTELRHVFVFKNTGTSTLVIKNIKPG